MTPRDINATIAWAKVRQNGMHNHKARSIILLASEYDRLMEAVETLVEMGKEANEALSAAKAETERIRGFASDEFDYD